MSLVFNTIAAQIDTMANKAKGLEGLKEISSPAADFEKAHPFVYAESGSQIIGEHERIFCFGRPGLAIDC